MNLEARPWLVDFHAAAAIDSFPFFGVLRPGWFSLGCFWLFLRCQFRVWNVSCLIGLGLGWFLRFFRPDDPPTQCWAMIGVIGALNLGTGL